jgi:hypothetical protein
MARVAFSTLGIMIMCFMVWRRPADADDFAPFYRAARLIADHADVYSRPAWSPDSESEGRFLPYIRIPSYAAALTPVASLPYRVARRIWIGGLIAALGACIWLFPGRRADLATALAVSFPVADALIIGQDICFVLLIVLASARVFSKGREFTAGLLASLVGIKLTYLPAAGIVFLARSRRGTAGFAAGFAIQAAVSFGVGGAGWPGEYAALLRSPLLDPEPTRMLNIRAVVAWFSMPGALYIVAGAGLYLLFWFACRRLTVPDGLTIGLALSVIAAPHSKIYDGVALIPLFLRVATWKSWPGRIALFALTPILYLCLLMGSAPLDLVGSSVIVFGVLACAGYFVAGEAYRGAGGLTGSKTAAVSSS